MQVEACSSSSSRGRKPGRPLSIDTAFANATKDRKASDIHRIKRDPKPEEEHLLHSWTPLTGDKVLDALTSGSFLVHRDHSFILNWRIVDKYAPPFRIHHDAPEENWSIRRPPVEEFRPAPRESEEAAGYGSNLPSFETMAPFPFYMFYQADPESYGPKGDMNSLGRRAIFFALVSGHLNDMVGSIQTCESLLREEDLRTFGPDYLDEDGRSLRACQDWRFVCAMNWVRQYYDALYAGWIQEPLESIPPVECPAYVVPLPGIQYSLNFERKFKTYLKGKRREASDEDAPAVVYNDIPARRCSVFDIPASHPLYVVCHELHPGSGDSEKVRRSQSSTPPQQDPSALHGETSQRDAPVDGLPDTGVSSFPPPKRVVPDEPLSAEPQQFSPTNPYWQRQTSPPKSNPPRTPRTAQTPAGAGHTNIGDMLGYARTAGYRDTADLPSSRPVPPSAHNYYDDVPRTSGYYSENRPRTGDFYRSSNEDPPLSTRPLRAGPPPGSAYTRQQYAPGGPFRRQTTSSAPFTDSVPSEGSEWDALTLGYDFKFRPNGFFVRASGHPPTDWFQIHPECHLVFTEHGLYVRESGWARRPTSPLRPRQPHPTYYGDNPFAQQYSSGPYHPPPPPHPPPYRQDQYGRFESPPIYPTRTRQQEAYAGPSANQHASGPSFAEPQPQVYYPHPEPAPEHTYYSPPHPQPYATYREPPVRPQADSPEPVRTAYCVYTSHPPPYHATNRSYPITHCHMCQRMGEYYIAQQAGTASGYDGMSYYPGYGPGSPDYPAPAPPFQTSAEGSADSYDPSNPHASCAVPPASPEARVEREPASWGFDAQERGTKESTSPEDAGEEEQYSRRPDAEDDFVIVEPIDVHTVPAVVVVLGLGIHESASIQLPAPIPRWPEHSDAVPETHDGPQDIAPPRRVTQPAQGTPYPRRAELAEQAVGAEGGIATPRSSAESSLSSTSLPCPHSVANDDEPAVPEGSYGTWPPTPSTTSAGPPNAHSVVDETPGEQVSPSTVDAEQHIFTSFERLDEIPDEEADASPSPRNAAAMRTPTASAELDDTVQRVHGALREFVQMSTQHSQHTVRTRAPRSEGGRTEKPLPPPPPPRGPRARSPVPGGGWGSRSPYNATSRAPSPLPPNDPPRPPITQNAPTRPEFHDLLVAVSLASIARLIPDLQILLPELEDFVLLLATAHQTSSFDARFCRHLKRATEWLRGMLLKVDQGKRFAFYPAEIRQVRAFFRKMRDHWARTLGKAEMRKLEKRMGHDVGRVYAQMTGKLLRDAGIEPLERLG